MYKINYPNDADVVFTTYFSSKDNPQKSASGSYNRAPKNNISYIYAWYVSVMHLGLNGVIIHDGLSDDFVNKYTCPNLIFIKYELGGLSINDERYFALFEILKNNNFKKVMITDGSDVFFKKNPFEFIDDMSILYFGSDIDETPRIKNNIWCLSKASDLQKKSGQIMKIDESFLDFEFVNAGVVGGSYEKVKLFMEKLVFFLSSINDGGNHNMMAINYLLWKYQTPYFKGAPFTSPFKKYELHGDYFIVHK
jgi:hypothetical protein